MSNRRGDRIGPYEVLALIGRGAMGEVYRARDARMGRDVALKVLSPDDDAETRARFEASGRAASRLAHPNLVTTYEVGADGGVPYIAMELLHGLTLRDALDRDRLSVSRALDYAVQMADGLAAVHAAGLVHRDLKPGNVFVTTDDRVKLLDFGLARVREPALAAPADAGRTVTLPGTLLGTVAYMAPEQVRGLPADHRSDIFALGVVIYEMVSGARPFGGETTADTMSAILTAEPPPLSVSGDVVAPPALARIVTRCLEKDASRRFQSAADLRFAIEQVRIGTGDRASEGGRPPVVAGRSGAWTRAVWPLAAAGVLLAAAALLGLLAGRGWMPPAEGPLSLVRFAIPIPQPSSAPLHVSLSPDGSRVAIGGGRVLLWLHDLATGQARRLGDQVVTGIGGWSADAAEVLLVTGGRLVRAPVDGGRVTALADVKGYGGADWRGASEVLYGDAGAIRRVPATGGASSVLCEPSGDLRDLGGPVVAGSRVLFYARDGTPEGSGIYASPIEGGCQPRLVTAADSWPVFVPPDRLLFTRRRILVAQRLDPGSLALVGEPIELAGDVREAGARMVFDASPTTLVFRADGASTPRRLRLMTRTGQALRDLTGPGLYRHPSLARAGDEILVSRFGPIPDVVSIDTGTGIETPLTSQVASRFARWSPDRRAIAYAEAADGGWALVVKPARLDGEKRVLLKTTTLLAVHDWSPDGRYILFEHADLDGVADLFAVRADGHGPPEVVSAERGEFDTSGTFSPDGRFVAYTTLGSQVFVKSFPGEGLIRRVSVGAGIGPRWRPGGQELFFLDAQPTAAGWRMMSAPVRVGDDGVPVIGTPVPLFTTRAFVGGLAPNLGAPYDVSADGERFLVLETTGDVVEPVNVVLNWSRLLPPRRGGRRRGSLRRLRQIKP